MDPSIMKILEDDEDETMHSGADVDAFQAALNRDIGGDASTSRPSESSTATSSHDSNQTSSQPFPTWQQTGQGESVGGRSQPDLAKSEKQQEEQHPSMSEQKQQAAGKNEQQDNTTQVQQMPMEQVPVQASQPNVIQIPETSPRTVPELQKMKNLEGESQFSRSPKTNPQNTVMDQGGGQKSQKQIPFGLLLPILKPHLDKDREMQLQTLFNKLRSNDIPKEQFVRHLKAIVGDHVLKMAVSQLQSQGPNQSQLQAQALARQQTVRMPVTASTAQFPDSHLYVHHQRAPGTPADPSQNALAVRMPTGANYQSAETNSQKARSHLPDSHGMQEGQMPSLTANIVNQERDRASIPAHGQTKQQQHLHLPQSSFPMYASTVGNYHPYSGANISTVGSGVKPQPHELQMRPISQHQSIGATQFGGSTQAMNMANMPKFDSQGAISDLNRAQSGAISHLSNKATLPQNSVPLQASANKEQISAPNDNVKKEPFEAAPEQGKTVYAKDAVSVSSSIANPQNSNAQAISRIPPTAASAAINSRTPPKKTSIGQKKPLEALGSSPPASSNKKQKLSGAYADQSIEQLNDVTAVSGVNLREEEEQLFSGSKDDSQVSEASRKVVQEEEERLILQKIPLQKKLAEIMAKCGLKNISNDVERCLSLCVEERMRGLISNLIRLSKQRVDIEKPRHRTIITSDVRQQIMVMNQKAREEWEKKQAEAEKLRKSNQPEDDSVVEGDKEKDEGRAKSSKVQPNKEEDDKMRTTAANVAARAAVGGADMFSKWQLMAEQKRQKRDDGEPSSGSQPTKDAGHKPFTASGRQAKEGQDSDKRSPATSNAATSGSSRKFGRNQIVAPRVPHTISVKDVIAVLEREPQMSRSTLIYRLYEKIKSGATTE